MYVPLPDDHHQQEPGFGWDRYNDKCPLYSKAGLPDWDSRLQQVPAAAHGSYEDDGSRMQVFERGGGVGDAKAAVAAAAAAVIEAAMAYEEPKPKEEKTFFAIHLVDGDGNPVGNVKYKATLADGDVREGTLDGSGKARLEGVPPGEVKVTFPELHGDDWGG